MSYRIKILLLSIATVIVTEFYTTVALPEETPPIIEVQSLGAEPIETIESTEEIQEPEHIEEDTEEIIVEKPIPEGYNIVASHSMIATAYGCVEMGGGSWSRTRSGTIPTQGKTIAVDPSIIPLGSLVYVECPTYPQINGIKLAEDTGGAIQGNIIDVYFDDVTRDSDIAKKEMLEFGRREIQIYVLSKY